MKQETTITELEGSIQEPAEFTLRKIRCGHESSFLKKGSRGPGVEMIQNLLSSWVAKYSDIEGIDPSERGVFGVSTERVLSAFQDRMAMDNHYKPVDTKNTESLDQRMLLTTSDAERGQLGAETLCLLECASRGQLNQEAWERLQRATRQQKRLIISSSSRPLTAPLQRFG